MNLYKTVLMFVLCYGCNAAVAKDFALLVGVSDYPDLPSLEGPQYDVEAISASLQDVWAFPQENITLLQDTEATKDRILNTLDNLYQNSQADDNIFIYFSGHGTSYFDLRVNAPLPHTTGAFIPYDHFADENDAAILSEKLIIGSRDLRPRLEKFDQGGRHLFVALDACYSGSTVRGGLSSNALPTRYFDLFSKALRPLQSKKYDNKPNKPIVKEDDQYPYNNIYYLGASSQYEEAAEISSQWLHQYPTIDGKPHGAFTDSLLRILSRPLVADVNKDLKVSYGELKQSVTELMKRRRFQHTPHGLPTLVEDKNDLRDKPVFFIDPKITALSFSGSDTSLDQL